MPTKTKTKCEQCAYRPLNRTAHFTPCLRCIHNPKHTDNFKSKNNVSQGLRMPTDVTSEWQPDEGNM